MARTREQRLIQRMKKNADTGCWEWVGPTSVKGGYGIIMINRRRLRVHRVAAELWLGFDPTSSLIVCHNCDNPCCFNPDHLFLGTHADNTADMRKKDRGVPQEQHSLRMATKLTEPQVIEIRRLVSQGLTLRQIAEQFGVSHEMVRRVRDRRSWSWVA